MSGTVAGLGRLAFCFVVLAGIGCKTPDDRAGTVPVLQSDDAGADGPSADTSGNMMVDGGPGADAAIEVAPPVSASVRLVHLSQLDSSSRLALYANGTPEPLVTGVTFETASPYTEVQLPSQAAELVVRLASDSSLASPRASAAPLGTLSPGDRITVLAGQDLSSPLLMAFVERFGPAVAGSARVRFVDAFRDMPQRETNLNGLSVPLPDRVYASDGTCLVSLDNLGESGPDGVIVPAAVGANDFTRVWLGLPNLSTTVYEIPGVVTAERADLFAAFYGTRRGTGVGGARLFVVPAQGTALAPAQSTIDASFDLVNAVPDFTTVAITTADSRGRVQDETLLGYAQSTVADLAKTILVLPGGPYVVSMSAGYLAPYTDSVDGLEEDGHYGVVLAGSTQATDSTRSVRATAYRFPAQATCNRDVNSNILLTALVNAAPDLGPAELGYVDGGNFVSLSANVSFGATQASFVELPAGMGGSVAVRVGAKILQQDASSSGLTVTGCQLLVLAPPDLSATSASANPHVIPVNYQSGI